MAGALGKTMLMRVENNSIPCYSAAGNKRKIVIKERVDSLLLSSKEPAEQGLTG
jgi:hypothetical protein